MTPRRNLSEVRHIGAWHIAALEEWSVSAWSVGVGGNAEDAIGGGGTKRPVAILLLGPDGLSLSTPDGGALTSDALEALLPGALEQFVNRASRDTLPTKEEEER